MSATTFLEDLQKTGFRLRLAGDGESLVVTPKSRLTPEVREAILARKPELFALLTRVQAFTNQMSEWAAAGRWAVPVLVLPESPELSAGRCISCGFSIEDGWRCATCLEAVHVALAMATRGEKA